MSSRIRIAFGLNLLICLAGLVVGVFYLFAPELSSYHKQVIGVEWTGLAPGVQKLLIVLMKGTGDAVLVAGVAMAVLLFIPFRRGENWSRWAILAVGSTALMPMLAGSIYLALTTGASSPWWLNVVMVACLIVGFILSGEMGGEARSYWNY